MIFASPTKVFRVATVTSAKKLMLFSIIAVYFRAKTRTLIASSNVLLRLMNKLEAL